MTELASDPVMLTILAGVFGLLIGSFLNVVIFRLPRVMQRAWVGDAVEILSDDDAISIVNLEPPERLALTGALASVARRLATLAPFSLSRPRSRCGNCGHQITALENIPVLSWVALRGRCSSCKTRISARYPIIELLNGILWAYAAWRFGPTVVALASACLISALLALTMIDADTLLLPDSITLPLLWAGIIFNLTTSTVPISASIIGAVAGYLLFWGIANLFKLVRGVEGMGAGDFKLLAALGAWFGWTALLPIVLISAGVGSIVGISLMVLGRANALTRLPFGVYLAPAGIVMLFFGRQLQALVISGVS